MCFNINLQLFYLTNWAAQLYLWTWEWRKYNAFICHRLYETPKKQEFVENDESALRWCRHVLDNPSPEMKAACRVLINRLEQSKRTALNHPLPRKYMSIYFSVDWFLSLSELNSPFYRRPAVFHHTNNVSLASSIDKTSGNSTKSKTTLQRSHSAVHIKSQTCIRYFLYLYR